jgi:hypothetical protein
MWHVIDPRQDINGNYGATDVCYRLNSQDVIPEMVIRGNKIFGRYLSLIGASRLVDKYPELIFRIGYVRTIFPDAKFVFIYRNGIDACQSIAKWSERLGRSRFSDLEDWWGCNDSKWLLIWNQLIKPEQEYQEVAALDIDSINHVNRAALEWIVTMREGLAQEKVHGDCMIRLRYESLLTHPDTELPLLLEMLGLDNDDNVLDYARKSLYDNPAKQSPALLPPVKRLFDETMAQLGY